MSGSQMWLVRPGMQVWFIRSQSSCAKCSERMQDRSAAWSETRRSAQRARVAVHCTVREPYLRLSRYAGALETGVAALKA